MIKLKSKEEIIDLIKQIGIDWNVSDRQLREEMLEILGGSNVLFDNPVILFKGNYEPGIYKDIVTGKEYNYNDSETITEWKNIDYIKSVDDLEYLRVQLIQEENDGDGNECTRIFHIPQYDLYIRVVGTYSSWSSPRWYGAEIVKPRQVTVTVYDSER